MGYAGFEVNHQPHLPLGHSAAPRYDGRAQRFGPVVRAQAAREKAVAVSDMNDVGGTAAGGAYRARNHGGPGIDVLPGIADDGGLAGGAAGSVHAHDVVHRYREHAEGIVGAQVGLCRERKLCEIREIFQIAGANAGGVEGLAVVRHLLVRVLQGPAQPIALQGAQLVDARLLDRLGLIHCAHHFINPGSQVASWGKATMMASSATSATLNGITPRNTVPIVRWRSRLFTTKMFIPTGGPMRPDFTTITIMMSEPIRSETR